MKIESHTSNRNLSVSFENSNYFVQNPFIKWDMLLNTNSILHNQVFRLIAIKNQKKGKIEKKNKGRM